MDAKNKPVEIPATSWPHEQEIYTIDKLYRIENSSQLNQIGVTLKEISIPSGLSYETYRLERFRPATQDDHDALAAMEGLLEELEIGEFILA